MFSRITHTAWASKILLSFHNVVIVHLCTSVTYSLGNTECRHVYVAVISPFHLSVLSCFKVVKNKRHTFHRCFLLKFQCRHVTQVRCGFILLADRAVIFVALVFLSIPMINFRIAIFTQFYVSTYCWFYPSKRACFLMVFETQSTVEFSITVITHYFIHTCSVTWWIF